MFDFNFVFLLEVASSSFERKLRPRIVTLWGTNSERLASPSGEAKRSVIFGFVSFYIENETFQKIPIKTRFLFNIPRSSYLRYPPRVIWDNSAVEFKNWLPSNGGSAPVPHSGFWPGPVVMTAPLRSSSVDLELSSLPLARRLALAWYCWIPASSTTLESGDISGWHRRYFRSSQPIYV